MRPHNSITATDRYSAALIFLPQDDATYWASLKEAKQLKENKYFILGFLGFFCFQQRSLNFPSVQLQEKELLLGHPELWYLIRKEERIEAEKPQATLTVSGEEKEIKGKNTV